MIKIFSETNMWTPSGICVVDQSAEYYRKDGYWNGAVWMPAWFMWKTMLDPGRPDLAWKLHTRRWVCGKAKWMNHTMYSNIFWPIPGAARGGINFPPCPRRSSSGFPLYFETGAR